MHNLQASALFLQSDIANSLLLHIMELALSKTPDERLIEMERNERETDGR